MVWSLENTGSILPNDFTFLGLNPAESSSYALSLTAYSDSVARWFGLLQLWTIDSIDSAGRAGIDQAKTVSVWNPVTYVNVLDGTAAGQGIYFYAPDNGVIQAPTPFEFWAFLP